MSHRQQNRGLAAGQRVDTGMAELVGDPGRPGAWTLLVDGIPQSHVDLDDPQYLEFEYMRRLGHLVDLAAPARAPLRVLHLGAGGLTLARYVAATRPGSSQLAVESDAPLVQLVRQRLPLDQPGRRASRTGNGRVRVRIADARDVLEQVPAGSFDLVVADLFAGARTPARLTTAEFVTAAGRALAPSGTYAVNVGDGPPLAHARARVATVRSVFPCACLIADAAVLRGRRFGNLVLAAARRPLPVPALARRVAGDPFPARLVHDSELDRFAAGARPITDAQAQSSPAPPPGTFTVLRAPGQTALCTRAAGSRFPRQRCRPRPGPPGPAARDDGQMPGTPDTYLHGHHDSVLRSHRWRTPENSAGYLLARLPAAARVLDVGCGPGTITSGLAARIPGGQVVGVDAAADVLAAARRDAAGQPNVRFEAGDVYRLAFGDGVFDVVHAHQVLQHLSDPVAALAEMRRVCRAGGLIAARDADYGGMFWFPEDPELAEWQALYQRVARALGGEPDAGRRMLSWARAAGFSSIETSASSWCYATPGDRSWWGILWAERLTGSSFGDRAVERGMASRRDLERLAAAWRRWAASEDGWFVIPHGEILCQPMTGQA